jgi:uncharacterized protein YegL
MKKDLCELIVVIDESGSMGSVVNDTIGGFNTFLDTHQKLPGEARLTLVKFDTRYEIVYNGLDVKTVKAMDKNLYSPSGMTALLDAVGKTIDEVGDRLSKTPEEERPEQVVFMIITDGEENSSREYSLEQIKQKTEQQQKDYNWQFVFMGADQDAWNNAGKMGVHNSVNFMQSDMGRTMKGMTYYSSNMRVKSVKTSLDNYSLTEEDLDKEIDKLTGDSKDDDKSKT